MYPSIYPFLSQIKALSLFVEGMIPPSTDLESKNTHSAASSRATRNNGSARYY